MSDAKIRILFVCLGNICRSPAAENVLRRLVLDRGFEDRIEIDSAGILGLHTGKTPDSRMIKAARNRGLYMKGSARQVRPEDFDTFDWILAMDQENYEDLLEVQRDAAIPKANSLCSVTSVKSATRTRFPTPTMAEKKVLKTFSIYWRMAVRGFFEN